MALDFAFRHADKVYVIDGQTVSHFVRGDANDDGSIDMKMLEDEDRFGLGGSAPPAPYPDPGFDITPDDLRCGRM